MRYSPSQLHVSLNDTLSASRAICRGMMTRVRALPCRVASRSRERCSFIINNRKRVTNFVDRKVSWETKRLYHPLIYNRWRLRFIMNYFLLSSPLIFFFNFFYLIFSLKENRFNLHMASTIFYLEFFNIYKLNLQCQSSILSLVYDYY